MTSAALSPKGVIIRLTTGERWAHIVEQHVEHAGMREEVIEAIAARDRGLGGNAGELLVVKYVARAKLCL